MPCLGAVLVVLFDKLAAKPGPQNIVLVETFDALPSRLATALLLR
jgi:hypothetical protein